MSGPKNASDEYVGSEPWLSKEILTGGIITDKADVFSFGLVVWEMLALDVPHVGLMNTSGKGTRDSTVVMGYGLDSQTFDPQPPPPLSS